MTPAVAHRGLSSEFAENTIAAFEAAADAGADGIELDVRLTGDGQVVVIHDAGIDRTTDGNGRVADMAYDEINSYDTGDGSVPLLEHVFEDLEGWPGHWNIEVKHWKATGPVLGLLERFGLQGQAMVSAMDPRVLEIVAKQAPDLERALIVLGPPDDQDMAEAKELGCRWINVDHDFLDAPLTKRLQDAGFLVGAWTVNDTKSARELMMAGVDAIITDERAVLDTVKIEGSSGTHEDAAPPAT